LQHGGQIAAHRFDVRRQSGLFGDDRDIAVMQAVAFRLHQCHDVRQQIQARRSLPARLRVGEVGSQVAQRQTAQESARHGMSHHVRVGVALQPTAAAGDLHTAETQRLRCPEAVHVEAVADAYVLHGASSSPR